MEKIKIHVQSSRSELTASSFDSKRAKVPDDYFKGRDYLVEFIKIIREIYETAKWGL